MGSASLAFQETLKAVLTPVYAAAGPAGAAVPVLDDVPQGQAFPYLTIGEDVSVNWGDFGPRPFGEDLDVTIHFWSRYAGRKEVKGLMWLAQSALHEKQLAVTGQHLAKLMLSFQTTMEDPDGKTRHGIQRYRVLLRRT